MQKYAYTDRCRRGFVLRYFGDPAATNRCEQCDNCLGLKHEAVSSGTAAASLRKKGAKAGRARSGGAKAMAGTPALEELTDDERSLLDSLRALRKSIAHRDSVPAYVVFADRTLREMARARPRTAGAMADIYGVGPAKMEKYGEDFLSALREA
jgi:ATP-dependent DNA helicase RecQ